LCIAIIIKRRVTVGDSSHVTLKNLTNIYWLRVNERRFRLRRAAAGAFVNQLILQSTNLAAVAVRATESGRGGALAKGSASLSS